MMLKRHYMDWQSYRLRVQERGDKRKRERKRKRKERKKNGKERREGQRPLLEKTLVSHPFLSFPFLFWVACVRKQLESLGRRP
jgi:hypothetical protein